MTKIEFIHAAYKHCKLDHTRKSLEDAWDAFALTMTDAMVAGDQVRIPYFGLLRVHRVKAGRYHNPRTKKWSERPAYRAVKFTTATTLKRALSGKK